LEDVGTLDADLDVEAGGNKEVYTMLPLDTMLLDGDTVKFKNQGHLGRLLDNVREANADGFMVDVWWGLTERKAKVYDFAAYKDLVRMAEEKHLKVQMVASFHRCGGNVNDECDIKLPQFVLENREAGIFYKDQLGFENEEYISLFADAVKLQDGSSEEGRTPLEMYADWFTALADAFKGKLGKTNTITEIQVGLGPAGELRYPSYNFQAGWDYCGIGAFQAFDIHALDQLRKEKNITWPPLDPIDEYFMRRNVITPGKQGIENKHRLYQAKPWDTPFFRDGGGAYQGEGQKFLGWYSGKLQAHGVNVLKAAKRVFGDDTIIAGKVAGIHWWYNHASHAAELTAGYWNTQPQNKNGDGSRNVYWEIAQAFKEVGASLDFTCLEMKSPTPEQDKIGGVQCQSNPEDLVWQVQKAAVDSGVPFNGENALPRFDWGAYDQILKHHPALTAFTYLRLGDQLVSTQDQGNDGIPFENFKRFVRKMKQQ